MFGRNVQSWCWWVLLPCLNFITWFYFSRSMSTVQPINACVITTTSATGAATTTTITAAAITALPFCADDPLSPSSSSPPTPSPQGQHSSSSSSSSSSSTSSSSSSSSSDCQSPWVDHRYMQTINVQHMNTEDVDKFRVAQLADMIHPESLKGGQNGFLPDTYMLSSGYHGSEISCQHLKWTVRDSRAGGGKCLAVAYVHESFGNLAQGPLRFDQDIDDHNLRLSTYKQLFGAHGEYKKKKPKLHEELFIGNNFNHGHYRPVGLFRKVPKERGHARTVEKLGAFTRHFDGPNGIDTQLREMLDRYNVRAGADLVVMVINEGEIDLFLNFACSCRLHNISTSQVLVFAGSREIVTMIESTGAMGIYHEGYSAVSKKPSTDYLDRPFVDMMWYKAFSVYLILRLKINVLFQDVDLVWFRDPFPVFHNWTGKPGMTLSPPGKQIEAFFSDDAQRSLRYSPFYANSGFYYLKATPRTEYFTWSIMTIYDAVQVLGSHQNVLTTRLVEELSLTAERVAILPLEVFPGGVHYHHDQAYMRRLAQKKEHPYVFHMCWTQGKPDKLIYLRKAHMWYLTDACSPLENLTPDGHVFGLVLDREEGGHDAQKRWASLSAMCCRFQDDKSP